jgi:hypothetical protein
MALFCAISNYAQNDIEELTVEIYYVSDANDATDTDGGPALPEGSVTYRLFLNIATGSQLKAIYGSANHPLVISSTEPFFNNEQRGRTFGYQIQNNFINRNTVALDSWLSFGAASNARFGIPKSDDTDGSIVGGENSDGGSESIPGGMLVNNDPLAGIPLTESDGLMTGDIPVAPPSFTVIPSNAFDQLFRDVTSTENTFNSTGVIMQTTGVTGFSGENRILIAQLTTKGELAFELNVEIINAQGDIVKYVAVESPESTGEIVNSFLKYPPQCGCTNPDYLEFSPSAGCDDGSCLTLIQFGCLEPDACNYNPDANFNVPGLCCFGPENCNGLDISIVCPALSVEDTHENDFQLFPNPTRGFLAIGPGNINVQEINIRITDLAGNVVYSNQIWSNDESALNKIDVQNLEQGMYAIQLTGPTFNTTKLFVKM